jgi:hypothetical protein
VERMCASVAFWSGLKMRGDGRWPAIERWMEAFEALPSYMATKSDYYTHVMDIPPQYGPGYSLPGSEAYAARISGRDGSWKLPLPPLSAKDIEPYGPHIDPGEEAARHEAALKLARNHENVAKFALRGAGEPGAKRFQVSFAIILSSAVLFLAVYCIPVLFRSVAACAIFIYNGHKVVTYLIYAIFNSLCLHYISVSCFLFLQAPLADPYAIPALQHYDDMDVILKQLTVALLDGYKNVAPLALESMSDEQTKSNLIKSMMYLRDRIGVPRDMSYPAARQLRAHINWLAEQL